MKLFFYAYKSWGHDLIWYFSCLCRKFSELRALLFLSQPNLKFIQKCPCLSSLKNKFQWTQKIFWPLIRKILIWTFWDYKSSWSKKSTPMYFQWCNSWECSVHFFRGPCPSSCMPFQVKFQGILQSDYSRRLYIKGEQILYIAKNLSWFSRQTCNLAKI